MGSAAGGPAAWQRAAPWAGGELGADHTEASGATATKPTQIWTELKWNLGASPLASELSLGSDTESELEILQRKRNKSKQTPPFHSLTERSQNALRGCAGCGSVFGSDVVCELDAI